MVFHRASFTLTDYCAQVTHIIRSTGKIREKYTFYMMFTVFETHLEEFSSNISTFPIYIS